MRLTLRTENPVRGSDQHSCSPGAPAVMITDDVPAFVFLSITRLAAWLRLSRREAGKTAEILILRHQLAVPQTDPAGAPRCRPRSRTDSRRSRRQLSSAVVPRSPPGPPGTSVPAGGASLDAGQPRSTGEQASARGVFRRVAVPGTGRLACRAAHLRMLAAYLGDTREKFLPSNPRNCVSFALLLRSLVAAFAYNARLRSRGRFLYSPFRGPPGTPGCCTSSAAG